MNRQAGRQAFYQCAEKLVEAQGGFCYLREANGKMAWPRRGVYFFWDLDGHRIVRVGTHALTAGSKSTLWGRLSQHQGSLQTGGGNHRGSIFRLLVGQALVNRGDHPFVRSWGLKADIGKAAVELGEERALLRAAELPLEQKVTEYIGELPFVCMGIDDDPGPESLRGFVERNSIALLSEFASGNPGADDEWLGAWSGREKVQKSGLWNNRHVDEDYSPDFVDRLDLLTM